MPVALAINAILYNIFIKLIIYILCYLAHNVTMRLSRIYFSFRGLKWWQIYKHMRSKGGYA